MINGWIANWRKTDADWRKVSLGSASFAPVRQLRQSLIGLTTGAAQFCGRGKLDWRGRAGEGSGTLPSSPALPQRPTELAAPASPERKPMTTRTIRLLTKRAAATRFGPESVGEVASLRKR
jgi:hypothetical protein